MGAEEDLGHNYMINNHVNVSWRGEGEGEGGKRGRGREREGGKGGEIIPPHLFCVCMSVTHFMQTSQLQKELYSEIPK